MVKRKKRTGLTKDNVFTKDKYRNIFVLIDTYSMIDKKIKLHHLKHVLVKGYSDKFETLLSHNHKLAKFFQIPNDKKKQVLEWYKYGYETGRLSKEEYEDFIRTTDKDIVLKFRNYGYFKENVQFSSQQSLSNALRRLKNLNLIEPVPESKGKGYPYYVITPMGKASLERFLISRMIKEFIPDGNLLLLRNLILWLVPNVEK